MTGICAILGNREGPVSATFETVLESLAIRGSSRRTVSAKTKDGKSLLLGLREFPSSSTEGLTTNGDFVLSVDGYYTEERVLDKFAETQGFSAFQELFKTPGAFAFVSVGMSGLFAGRDSLGQKPLYYGTEPEEGIVAFASLRSPLDEAGVSNVKPVLAGTIVSASDVHLAFEDVFRLQEPTLEDAEEHVTVQKLGQLMIEAVSKTVPNGSALAFSGGLDSGLVAEACKRAGRNLTLVTVGVEGQPELAHAQEMADELELPVIVRELTKGEVVNMVPDVVETVESTDPTVVGVALPFYATCQVTRAEGMTHIVAGQLSDEMFGGYGRFEELAGKESMIRKEVWDSVQAAATNDFEPGDKTAVAHQLELRCPFAYLPLVCYGLKIPPKFKVSIVDGKPVRKYILRKLATSWRLPEQIATRPKKAIQYSTGVINVLEKEARSRGLGLREFFQEQLV